MQINAPELTALINLLIAVVVFGSVVGGGLWKLRAAQRKDMTNIVETGLAPLKSSLQAVQNDVTTTMNSVNAHEREIGKLKERSAALEGAVFKRPVILEDEQ